MSGTMRRLTPSAPAIAPRVLAAYTPPTRRPGSPPRSAIAARARGKLAPQRIAGGRIAHRQRTISSWNVCQGFVVSIGLIGQYGNERVMMKAVQAIPNASRIWHDPSATRGDNALDRCDPAIVHNASPIR